MYAGSTFTPISGKLLGAHQKIDRVAWRQLQQLAPKGLFPSAKLILHFEGDNGPDAIKRKSPAKDEPWHYIQPFDPDDTELIDLIEDHHKKLVKALKAKDMVRAAFEAAWLAHAIVDGLTPAHHYPYEEKLVELSSGRSIEERTTVGKKVVMPGDTRSEQLSNNWKMWGPKGLFVTHTAFEWGVAVLIAPLKFRRAPVNAALLADFETQKLGEWFRRTAQNVARLELYDDFYKKGWTISLARRVRSQLAPVLVQSVALVWYDALREAGRLEAA
ncbi:MAG TPA: hypothetical protein VF401_02475 [Candidatus Saccharimonadales bacterium]